MFVHIDIVEGVYGVRSDLDLCIDNPLTVNTQCADAGYEADYKAARKLLDDEIRALIDQFDDGLIA